MRFILTKASRFLAVLAALASILLVMAISYDVGYRTFIGGSVPGMLELSETLLVLIIFLGLAYAEQVGVHVRTTIATARIPSRIAFVVRSIAYLISVVFIGWLAWSSIGRAQAGFASGESKMGLMQWPIWPSRIFLAVGVVVLTLEILVSLIDNIRSAADPDYAEKLDREALARRSMGV